MTDARALMWLAAALAVTRPAMAGDWTFTVQDATGRALPKATIAVLVRGERSTAPAGTKTAINQWERQFEPQVSVIQTGTAVQFPNFDTVRHHVYSFSPIARFELKLYAGTPAAPVKFDRPGTATLGCNIHDRMQAWVHVVDTPLYAVTDDAGRAVLDLPPGEHRLELWHPRWPEDRVLPLRPLTVATAAATGSATLVLDLPATTP